MSVRALPRDAGTWRPEHRDAFRCFGGQCTVIVADAARPADAAVAAAMAKRALLAWHLRFSRFDPDSELSRLNRDPARMVSISPLMGWVIEAALRAARDTGGLVDATLADEIEFAGYEGHFDAEGAPPTTCWIRAPGSPRSPGSSRPARLPRPPRRRRYWPRPRSWVGRRGPPDGCATAG
jgi:hypothetical protein